MKVCVRVRLRPERVEAWFQVGAALESVYPLFLALMISRCWQQRVAAIQHNCPWATPHG